MFNKKKKAKEKPRNTFLDNKLHELTTIDNRLCKQVRKIVEKQAVIDIYPPGPDQDKAIKDLESAKYHLLYLIGEYDITRKEYYDLKKKHPECEVTDFPTSHDAIEIDYKIVTNKY